MALTFARVPHSAVLIKRSCSQSHLSWSIIVARYNNNKKAITNKFRLLLFTATIAIFLIFSQKKIIFGIKEFGPKNSM